MPNSLTASGLVLKTREELIAEYTESMRAIYGGDINLDQDTPDGQMMNIHVQAALDLQDLIMEIYNSFDPDTAFGVTLDRRVAINGIQRQAGTHTTTNISITTTRALNLYGLDQSAIPVYTVSDSAGNKWQLKSSVAISGAGTYPLVFQSAVAGKVLTIPNTINVPVSIVLGVSSINNPTTYLTLGIDEESDVELKVRRQKAVSLSSLGFIDSLIAALENIPSISSVFVYENTTGSTDGDGIPSHSIWVIVSGAASDAEIAQAIYKKRSGGCGMKGSKTYNITQADGSTFTVRWDEVQQENLFIKFTATSLDGVNPPNVAAIRAGLVNSFVPGVAEKVNINTLTQKIRDIDPNCLVTNAGFSTAIGGAYTNTLTPSAKNKQFAVSSANIVITPILLTPSSLSLVVGGATKTFTAAGGYGTLTFSLQTNASGGSINGVTGLYTTGAIAGTDVVRVTDSLGNFTQVNVTVSV